MLLSDKPVNPPQISAIAREISTGDLLTVRDWTGEYVAGRVLGFDRNGRIGILVGNRVHIFETDYRFTSWAYAAAPEEGFGAGWYKAHPDVFREEGA